MTIVLIIFSVILVLSVIAHYFFWKDSKKRYEENRKEAESIKERIKQLEESNEEMDMMLDDAENAMERILLPWPASPWPPKAIRCWIWKQSTR